MHIDVSEQTEARLIEEASKQGVSVEALLERFVNERATSAAGRKAADLPVWHLGHIGSLHRRDIYDGVD
jgi:hypothetical protein